MLFIKRWLRTLQRLLRRTRPTPTPTPPPLPPEVPVLAAEPAPPEPVVTEISSNRHERRALERARRKYDKFVVPAGQLPEKPKRKPQEIKPRIKRVEVITPADQIDDAEIFIAEDHHENRNDRVAYKESELYGEFNFRDTILQQLERYFVYLERMKRKAPDAYGLYKEIGATLVPYIANGSWQRDASEEERERSRTFVTPLADWFNKTRPSFGCYVFGADPETEKYEQTAECKDKAMVKWVPKFMYYTKYRKPPPEMQLISGGDIYSMTVYWDRPFDKKFKYGVPQEFGIYVSSDGKEVTALRCCDTKYVPIRHKVNRSHQRRGEVFHVPQRAWHIPGEFEQWAHDNGEDAQHFLTELFKRTVWQTEENLYSMIRVTAVKDGMTAVFSVNIHRTAYFFQDRDIELTDDGKRKRIFHFVRPHTRHDGSTVKAHFRGENEFNWAGYQIRITVPGRDHLDIAELDLGTIDMYWAEKGKKYLSTPQLGKKLKTWMDEGYGKRA